MPSNQRSTLTNLSRNFDTDECKLIFDSQHNGTNDNMVNKKSKKAVMLNEREVAYRNEDARNSFTFMTIVIIIPCFYNVSGGLSALSTSLCTALVFRVFEYLRTRAMNVVGKCVVLMAAMQSFVHRQRDGLVRIEYRKELRSRYAKFVYYNNIHVA